MKNNLLAVFIVILLCSCASQSVIHPNTNATPTVKQDIIVFLDGTANTEVSRTNVAMLHNLVTLQPNPNIRSIYVQGVGTDGILFKPIAGMATGAGIGEDVREAYEYISKNYVQDRGDKIYIFGFSRGAYAARILAGLIYVAGIPQLNDLPVNTQNDFIEDIYAAYKGKKSIEDRREKIAGESRGIPFYPATIEFMGLWDTVEALGLPNFDELIENVNGKYVDQICNIKKAAHALSIDDNRAQIFTPISLTSKEVIKHCKKDISIEDTVDEVWFAGAHSDVGGGYSDSELNGVSLNWMLQQISEFNIVPENTSVFEDPLGKSHDPSTGFFEVIYTNLNRNIPYYLKDTGYNGGKPKVHSSVFKRLSKVVKGAREFDWMHEGTAKYTRNYPECFEKAEDKTIHLKDEQLCFEVVE
jgi:uncharacterized protein (DUF2235 family)